MREATRAAIATAITEAWEGNSMPLIWENQPDPKPSTEAWARIGVAFGKGFPAAVGGTYDRLPGILWMQIFMPDKKGTKKANVAADAFEAATAKTRLAVTGTGWTGEIQFDQVAEGPSSSAGMKAEVPQSMCRIGFLVHRFTV